jgi:hypothetical protein
VANQQPDALRKQQRGGLAPFGLRIIRAMQPSAARGKTAECVAKRSCDQRVGGVLLRRQLDRRLGESRTTKAVVTAGAGDGPLYA